MAFRQQDNGQQPESTRSLGDLGERIAAKYLESKGYRLVIANFKVPIGRNANSAQVTGEIDIIAFEGKTLCFVEVKTRSSDTFAGPLSAVNLRKQRQIIRTARVYRRIFGIRDIGHRYDVVTIVMGNEPVIELVKGFWSEAKFKKRAWTGDIWEYA